MKFRCAAPAVDVSAWPRAAHYRLYADSPYPYVGVTTRLDVTDMRRRAQQAGERFFTRFLHALMAAVDAVENFRYRVSDGAVRCCERVDPSFTVLDKATGLFYFAQAPWDPDYRAFAENVRAAEARALAERCLDNGRADVVYVSFAPWTDFTDLIQPLRLTPEDCVPRFVAGRFAEEGGRVRMPFSVTAHHGFVDGYHLGQLFERLAAPDAGGRGASPPW